MNQKTTLIRWKNNDVCNKIINYCNNKGYSISDWCEISSVEKIAREQGATIDDWFKLVNEQELERKKKKQTEIKKYTFILVITFLVGLLLGFGVVVGYNIILKDKFKYSSQQTDILGLIGFCSSINGEVFEEGGRIGCSMVNQSRNMIIMGLTCKKYNLSYEHMNGSVRCI